MWKNLSNFSDVALLFLRVTLGGFFIWIHGWPKLAGGLATAVDDDRVAIAGTQAVDLQQRLGHQCFPWPR